MWEFQLNKYSLIHQQIYNLTRNWGGGGGGGSTQVKQDISSWAFHYTWWAPQINFMRSLFTDGVPRLIKLQWTFC